MVIGQKLRALRLDRGLSQSELGGMVGVTFQQLQKYEKGTNRVSAGRLARIATALDVPVTAFYGAAASSLRLAPVLRVAHFLQPINGLAVECFGNGDMRHAWSPSRRANV